MAKEKVVPPINCANDAQMVAEGLRQPILAVDRACFQKTDSEKAQAATAKASYKNYEKAEKLRRDALLSLEEVN